MASLMNGLSAAGQSLAQFAGQAGATEQKADLERQAMTLADQLATVRQTALEGQRQQFEQGQQGRQFAQQSQMQAAELGSRAAMQGSQQSFAASESEKARQLELTKIAAQLNAPTPEERDVRAYTGGATPGTPEYQRGVRDLALLKAGISPDLYGSTPSSPTQGAASPQPADTGSTQSNASTATPSVVSDTALPPGTSGLNEGVLAGKPAWLVAKVKAINEGREEPPNPRSMNDPKSPEFVANALLQQYNPNFDATLYPRRLEAQKAITPGGSLAVSIGAMNTSMFHAAHLMDLFNQLGNYGGGEFVNAPLNTIAEKTGHYPVINQIRQTIHAMAEEGNKIYQGNAGTESSIDRWEQSFPVNGSIADQQGAVQNFAKLMAGKFEPLAAQVNTALGDPRAPIDLLNKSAASTYTALTGNPPVNSTVYQKGIGSLPAAESPTSVTPRMPALPPGFRVIQ